VAGRFLPATVAGMDQKVNFHPCNRETVRPAKEVSSASRQIDKQSKQLTAKDRGCLIEVGGE